MPEQAEWMAEHTDERNTAQPNYMRRAIDSLHQPYDTRTLGDKMATLQAEARRLRVEVEYLQLCVHGLMNPGEAEND